MEPQVRTIVEDEVPAWCAALNLGFLKAAGAADAEARRPGLYLDRTWAGYDGQDIVSTLRSFPVEVTVPGGALLNASAVTAVTTTSTHRRQGLAARMIAADLAKSAEREDKLSVLIAAEWQIYGQFGYGAATEHQTWTVNARVARLRRRPAGTVHYVDRDTARAAMPEVYDRHRRMHPGELSRDDRFHDIEFGLLRYPSWPEDKPGFQVLARNPAGEVDGIARYSYEEEWDYRQPAGQVSVQLLVASTAEAEALLWHHLISLDLAATVKAPDRSTDELLPWLLADARHAQPSERSDFLWIRALDVPAMLESRTYPVAGELVLEVIDPAGYATGRFVVQAAPEGASCRPTTVTPDLIMGVSAFSSIYLGAHTVRTLAAAGLIEQVSSGAVATADDLLRSDVTPWCSTWF